MSANPFLPVAEFPDFQKMTPAAAEAALPKLLAEARSKVEALERGDECSWDGFMRALDEAQRPLWDAWGCVRHLLSVCNSDGWRKVQEKFLGPIVEFDLRVGQSKALNAKYKKLRDKLAKEMEKEKAQRGGDLVEAALPVEAKVVTTLETRLRILDQTILGGKLSGVDLESAKQKRFNEIQTELSKLSSDFRNHVLDSTKQFEVVLTSTAELDGVPESLRKTLAGENDYRKGPWRATIDDAVYYPLIKHSKNRPLRESMVRARATRATRGESDNTELLKRILALRQELATLLGYANYAELSLATKCAPSTKAVNAMIDEIAAVSKPVSVKEDAVLAKFAADHGFKEKLQPWDRSFWSERQREECYAYSEEELSKYFNLPVVLKGLFSLANRLFGVTVEAADWSAPVWHPDVRFFRVKNEKGETIAHFYFDPYSRPATKNGGAWANSFHSHERRADGSVRLPLALVCCNQAVPDQEGRALMRFSEVETLFHEFGHALQHMLSTVDDAAASGFGMIEWDAVEIASQFMENWCYDRSTVKSFARHCETNAPIPDALLEKVRSAKNYRAAGSSLGQLAYARTDFALHTSPPADPNALKNQVYNDLFPGRLVPEDRLLNSFTHIFCGGYGAGYYGYKWSEVMSADVFGAFEEAGLDNEEAVRKLGRKYRDTFLALGGSVPALEVFKRFRGRGPETRALLRQTGLLN